MHVWMLYKDKEYGSGGGYLNKDDVIKDLNLDLIFKTMSRDNKFDMSAIRNVGKEDPFLYDVAKRVMMIPLASKEEVLYRQGFVKEAIKNPDVFEEIYRIAGLAKEEIAKHKASEKERRNKQDKNAGYIIGSMEVLNILVAHLEMLKDYLDKARKDFTTKEMTDFYERFRGEYNDVFADRLKDTIHDMTFLTEGGVLSFSATLGQGMKEDAIIVNRMEKTGYSHKKAYFFPVRDEAKSLYLRLFKPNVVMLKEEEMIHDARLMEETVILHMLKYLEGFMKDYSKFFEELYAQTAFYLGCGYLYHRLVKWRIPFCFPVVSEDAKQLSFEDLHELSMSILMRKRPVSNDLNGLDKWLFIITGANQGGKSTYLRSIGIAQVLMQCGMYVPAGRYESNLHGNIYTHFTRREDSTMNSGRLDEELQRMDGIIRTVKPDSMILLNESFATTTEKEGSLIADDITSALYEIGTKVLMVTHLYAFAAKKYKENLSHALFQTAEREADGTRTFKILDGEPTKTSYGLDLYDKVIGG